MGRGGEEEGGLVPGAVKAVMMGAMSIGSKR